MNRFKKSIKGGVWFLILTGVLAISSCSSNKKIVPHEVLKPAYTWYNDGIQAYINHDYEDAEHDLLMISAQHPGSIYAKKAALILGDVYFSKGNYILARDYYRRFIKLYPDSQQAVYAKYKIALSYYKSRNSYKCDATPLREAIKEFLELQRQYPNNPFTNKINYYLAKSVEELYKHELFVAKFYADLDEFNAAKNRLNYMYKHFRGVNFNDEMLYLMGKVYFALNRKQQAEAFLNELIKKYPYSKYADEAKKLINEIKASK